MKNVINTVAVLFLLTVSAAFAQQTVKTGYFNLDGICASQPDLKYNTDGNNEAEHIVFWSVSANNNDEKVVVVKADPIKPWAEQNVTYHTASEDYLFQKVGAAIVWTVEELGVDLNNERAKVIFQKSDGSNFVYNFKITENGTNREVSYISPGGNY